MSRRWEEAIEEWYTKSHTSNLAYLDLAENSKPSLKEISNNIAVIYDRTCLSSRVHLKNFKLILEEIENLKTENRRLSTALKNLTKEVVENRPLTERKVEELILKIVAQPKAIEEQTIKLTEELRKRIDQVEKVAQRIETAILT